MQTVCVSDPALLRCPAGRGIILSAADLSLTSVLISNRAAVKEVIGKQAGDGSVIEPLSSRSSY